MSYIDFFEFKEHPFRITPDVEFYFTSETHSGSFESLKYFVGSDEGFSTLIGEPGTGKTITLRKFINELPKDVEYAYILFPSLEPEDMFRAVLEDFGYKIEQGVSKNTLFSGFRDFLTDKKKQGKRILLIIDEAQNLPIETMEELRILSNLETEKEKLIQFVLAGQPELADKLNSQKLRQLKQRISLQTELSLLNLQEIERYVVFRLSKAGFNGKYPSNKFYKKLQNITKGNPRLINLTMERALMAAYLKQSSFLVNEDIETAAESLKLNEQTTAPTETNSNKITYLLVAIIIAMAGLLVYQFMQKQPPVETKPTVIKQEPEPVKDIIVKPKPTPKPKQAEEPVIKKKSTVKKGYVITDNLNLRSKPTTKEKNILMKLNKGTSVIVKGNVGKWIMVETLSDTPVIGWVYSDFILIPE